MSSMLAASARTTWPWANERLGISHVVGGLLLEVLRTNLAAWEAGLAAYKSWAMDARWKSARD
jgi:hypothetical protein